MQTIRHFCPFLRCSLALPAVLRSGLPGVHVAQKLRYSMFIGCPSAPFEFIAFLVPNRALAKVWRTCLLLTTVLSIESALGDLDPQSLHYYNTFRVQILEKNIITDSKSELCTLIGGYFELIAGVL